MKYLFNLLIALTFTLTIKAETNEQFYFRTMINLADYIANDYPNAVHNGEVVNEFEFAEMAEFSKRILENYEEASKEYSSENFNNLPKQFSALNEAIFNKKSAVEVNQIAKSISTTLLNEGILINIPSKHPSILKGKQLYATHCQECHGQQGLGDGALGVNLDPSPANFKESPHLFPFHIYNTIQLGIEGTAMAPVALNEEETWDLAFYVMTLMYEDSLVNSEFVADALTKIDLGTLANSTNAQIEANFEINGAESTKALRFFEAKKSNREQSLELTLNMLQNAKMLYKASMFKAADKAALDAYFIGFEPVEIELGAKSPNKVLLIEKEMMIFRSYLKEAGNEAEIKEQYDVIAYHFEGIKDDEGKNGFWFDFIASISILLREGLEALLIIVAILAALNTFEGGKRAKKFVHFGWLSAAFIGVISYFFVNKLIALGAHNREIIEGFGALLAVVILLSVGFWLHDKSNAQSWSKYVKDKLSKHLSTNSLWSIAILSFVVVFREAFESVIFLSSITMGAESSSLAVFAGTIFSAILLLIIAIVIIKYAKKLPIHQVFLFSSITMIVLAIILAGKGVKELQEAALIGVNLLDFRFSWDLIGFYPTVQTISAQFFTLVVSISLWIFNKKKNV